jgi:alginate O-acetyltransferase complex protein AlgI
MVFSSPIFLLLFLPVVLAVYALLPGLKAKNLWLLLASLVFYAWGEVLFIFLLLASSLMNYLLGLWIDRSEDTGRRKLAVVVAVCANVGLLAFFKYADFFVASLNTLLRLTAAAPFPQPNIRLPIGISFFTFHAISYVVDIYRRKWAAATDQKDVALYIFFFPQLIAGPILRWNAIAPQLAERAMGRGQFAEGIRRFVGGLTKKMMIANALAVPADQIFALPADQLSAPVAWFGLVCYTLQVYFDFSGYSDMAVGMGKMFGFKFLENFNFPYLAQSIREIWQRWHISLMTWFRDYLYIPLGGSRVSDARTRVNLLIVFVLCGLWHGAGWTYVVFGFYQAFFVILERTQFGTWQSALPRPARHFYTMFVWMMGLVIFRSDTFTYALHYFTALFGLGHAPALQKLVRYVNNEAIVALVLGIPFCGPLWGWIKTTCIRLGQATPANYRTGVQVFGSVLETALVVGLLLISTIWLSGGTYNPFIYYRF